MSIFLPRSKVPAKLLKKVSLFIVWLLFFYPLLTAAQSLEIPKPSRPSHISQGAIIPQTLPLSSALPDREEETVRAASEALISSLLPLNTFPFTMSLPSSLPAGLPVSTEIFLYANTRPPDPGVSTGQIASSTGSVPQIRLPYPPLSTLITAVDTPSRQAQAQAQYRQGYELAGQQSVPVPVLMNDPFALSSFVPHTSQPPVGVYPAQGFMPTPIFTTPQPVPLPSPYQQLPVQQAWGQPSYMQPPPYMQPSPLYMQPPSYIQPYGTQQALVQPSYMQLPYMQPSWAANVSPLSYPAPPPSSFMSGPSFWPVRGLGPFAYLPPTPYLPSTPYGNTLGNAFSATTPYALSPLVLQPYPFSPIFGPIM